MMLGRILDFVDDDTAIMLISDHGFQPDHLRPRAIPREPAGPAYEHSPYGIFVLKGPKVKKDGLVFGASLLDITPTLLTLLGLPVGEDMDGKVLTHAFETEPDVAYIDSWENVAGYSGMPSEIASNTEGGEGNEIAAAKAMEQLVELGYVEKPAEGQEANNWKNTHDECQFNLARAYIDGGDVAPALPILEALWLENPEMVRFGFRLAVCYQLMGKLKETRAVIEQLKALDIYDAPILSIMEGNLLIGEGKPLKALESFRRAEGRIAPQHSKINIQLAQCYLQLKRIGKAEDALMRELNLDYDNPSVHALLGQIYLQSERFREAADSYLVSIGLDYNQPIAHFNLGLALKNLGDYANAAKALEVCLLMTPQYNRARTILANLYTLHLEQPERGDKHRQNFHDEMQGTVYVVSGMPRSGTSMMMQMLDAGGLPVFTDKVRTADDSNPKGYYEHEVVKMLARNKRWLPKAKDKVVKIVAPLLHYLPSTFRYKIVFMERNIFEIMASQDTMLKKMGKKPNDTTLQLGVMQQYQKQLAAVKKWAEQMPNVEIVYVSHAEVLTEPFEQALRVAAFLDFTVTPEAMMAAVDKSLHREKIGVATPSVV